MSLLLLLPAGSVNTDLEAFRLELGDLNVASRLYTDQQARYFIEQHPGHLLLAVAAAADALALRFANQIDFGEDGQDFKMSQRSKQYAALALRLRARATDEEAAGQDGAGMPIGRVPARRATTWFEQW